MAMEQQGTFPPARAGSSPVRTAKQVIIGVLVLVVLIVILQNTDIVTLHFLFWELTISQVLLIPLVLLLGFVIGMLTYSLIARRRRQERV